MLALLRMLPAHCIVILNVTEGGVRDLRYLSFKTGAQRRSTNSQDLKLHRILRIQKAERWLRRLFARQRQYQLLQHQPLVWG
jgi:hypothetical protein